MSGRFCFGGLLRLCCVLRPRGKYQLGQAIAASEKGHKVRIPIEGATADTQDLRLVSLIKSNKPAT
jgi:hypothetical protein